MTDLLSDGGEDHTAVSKAVGVIGALALVVGTVLALRVAFTGRPAALVPPHLRERAGRGATPP
jgi:hypothetical protein